MSVSSQIIEATNFTQQRVDFNIPQVLSNSIKIAGIGSVGTAGLAVDPVLGQLSCIAKITLRDGATVLSEYNRDIRSVLRFGMFAKSTNDDLRAIRRYKDASLTGFELRNSGTAAGDLAPKVCVDKKQISMVGTTDSNTRLATLNLADVLGWCNAVYSKGQDMVSGVMPCHLHKNLKLTIEWDAAGVSAGCVIAQPYMIFREVDDPKTSGWFSSGAGSIVGTYPDWEEEAVYLGAQTSNKSYLNSFYGKTVGKMVVIAQETVLGVAMAEQAEVLRLNVNNVPYFALNSGLNHEGKKAAFVRLAGVDNLAIPLHCDKVKQTVAVSMPDAPNNNSLNLIEGANANDTTGTLFYRAGCSYTVLGINQQIDSMQIDYSRATNAVMTLQFWGEVEKKVVYESSAPLVSYM